MNSTKPPRRNRPADHARPRIVAADDDAIERAAERLRSGDLVAFPTETVYGLGGDAENEGALRAIFAAKGRPSDHPLIVHLRDGSAIARWSSKVSDDATRLAQAFWPGPLTLILPRAPHVHPLVTGGQDSVGLRVPSHPVARRLLDAFARRGGDGIAAPSANRFGHVSPTRAEHVADDLGDRVSCILDGGASEVGIESTIVACLDAPMLLRPGGIEAAAIERVLGRELLAREGSAPRASGTLASHYAPRTQAFLVDAAMLRPECDNLLARDEGVAVLARTIERPTGFEGTWLQAPREASRYAHDLYANLRALDDADADAIVIEAVPDAPEWLAVRDRLDRATHDEDDRT
jgi:L-threonylcarbamoyladenylate synthase